MNPFHSIDELYFQNSSANYSLPIPTTIPDQILHDPVMDGSGLPCGKDHKSSIGENKKWIHRETEKQRRQEMTRLFTSFKSLLPLEYIKGKRSACDHIHEGMNYIKHLQNKVKKLQDKRDELMKLSNFSHVDPDGSGSFATYVINVHPCLGGVQIKCSYSLKEHAFPLSRMLDIVLKEGLNVITCISTKTDDRFIHTIQSEDPHWMNEANYIELQRKLIVAISSSSQEEI